MSKRITFFLGFVLSGSLCAGSIEYIGTIPLVISTDDMRTTTLFHKQHLVFVQHLRLSSKAQLILKERLDELSTTDTEVKAMEAALPTRVDLGMNKTPVLDQGVHGSCVTFAMTGAIDAVIGKGDYVSQLCSLELGSYLQQRGLIEYSGWDGSNGSVVLNQLNDYGLFPKEYQQQYGCAGVKKYPLFNENNTGKPMSVSEYSANALPLSTYASWQVLLDTEEAFSKNHSPLALLRAVKKSLREGKRVTFGMLLDDLQPGAGALGTFKKRLDSWVVTPEIIKHAQKNGLNAGHEMIIIGYDDKAVALTKNGQASKGLFIVRNSWGNQVGDGGNFYVSYEYFKAFADEAQVIIPN